MATSHHHQLSTIIDIVLALDPQSVLDVGPGFGKYGVLLRDYLELHEGESEYGVFKRRIDAMEIFSDYITPLHRYIYNNVLIGDVVTVVDTLQSRYDLILLIDVLEHIPKTEGLAVLKKLVNHNPEGGVLVSTPKDIGHQGETFGNPHEAHISQWRRQDFSGLANTIVFRDHISYILYIGPKNKVQSLRSRKIRAYIRALPVIPRVYFLAKRIARRPSRS